MSLHYQNIASVTVLLFLGAIVRGQPVQFSLDTNFYQLSEGHLRLEWTPGEYGTYQLQQATSADFADAKTIYEGPDLASFISGLNTGTYYFRVRNTNQPWSSPLHVEVVYQSLRLAFGLFGLGACVFLLTASVVIFGARQIPAESS